MTSFSDHSKYKGAATRITTTLDGDPVKVVETPRPEEANTLGWVLRRQGQRLDLLAYNHLNGPGDWWRLPDHNNQMVPDAVLEQPELAVPLKARDR